MTKAEMNELNNMIDMILHGLLIGACVMLIGTLAGSFLGVVAASRLTNYRLQMLEEKVNKHNNLIERTFVLEGQMAECRHDIKELKAYHRPVS